MIPRVTWHAGTLPFTMTSSSAAIRVPTFKHFLAHHGRLSEGQQTVIYNMLVWQLATSREQDAD